MALQSMKQSMLSLSIAVALAAASGSVFADGDRVEELEARVAELEALVQQLVSRPQPAPGPSAEEVEARAEAAAEEKFSLLIAEHKDAIAEAEHKHSYKFGGFVKTDFIYSDFGNGAYDGPGRDWYIPATVQVGESDSNKYLDFHAKESRINFRTDHILPNGGKLGAFLELDFQLSGQGDERISNSWSPRIRHAFVTYNKWLFGQTWMTFFNVGALPENLDFVGPAESTVFGRQPMIRYTNGPWQFAVENPSTTILGDPGGRSEADENRLPDVVGRYNMTGDWGSFTVAGILRELRYDYNGQSDSTNGYGVSLSGKIKVLERDDFRFMATFGKGLGRYVGINMAKGAVIDGDGNLHAIKTQGVFGSYRHFWNDKWRSNLTYGYGNVDNNVELTGDGVTKNASSWHVNLIYSPQPKLDFGVELLYAKREIESGADGDLTRLQFSAKYAY